MKVIKMNNDKGVERYYSGFYCKPLILSGDIAYAVDAEFYDYERNSDFVDCLKVFSDMIIAMTYCVELTKKLQEQPDADDSLYDAYFYQCKRLED